MQRISSSTNACNKICRANPSVINRRQCSTARTSNRASNAIGAFRSLPFSFSFAQLLTVKAATSRNRKTTLFMILFHRKRMSHDTSCFEIEILCPERACGTTNGTAAPAINIFAFCRARSNCLKDRFYDCISVPYPVGVKLVYLIEKKKKM